MTTTISHFFSEIRYEVEISSMKDVVNRFISRAEPWRFRIKKGNKKSSNDHIIIIDTAI